MLRSVDKEKATGPFFLTALTAESPPAQGKVLLKVVPVTGAAFALPWTNNHVPIFSHTHYWYKVGMLKVYNITIQLLLKSECVCM